MGCVEGTKGWMGMQRPMVVVMVAALVLLSAPADQAFVLHDDICPIQMKSAYLHPYDTVYLSTISSTVRVTMKADGCVNDTMWLDMSKFKVTNETSLSAINRKWYKFTFLGCGNYTAKIGTEIVKFSHEVLPSHCVAKRKPIMLSVGSDVLLGRRCTGSASRAVGQSKADAECKWLQKGGEPDADPSVTIQPDRFNIEKLFDLLDKQRNYDSWNLFNDDLPDPAEPAGDINDDKNSGIWQDPKEPEVDKGETFINWPKNNYDDILQATSATPSTYNLDGDLYLDNHTGYTKHRNYKENAIPIFIGIVAFTVSMCLRFCLCRGKSVVRRITTVTVIRSRPVGSPDAPQDQQDPPPSYVDVVTEATSPESPADDGSAEPPPPAYADIVDEVQPPTYSEVEAQAMPASEEVPLADQEGEAQTTQPPTNPEPVPDAKGLAPTKKLLSKYRSQKKQYAFKVLEDD